MGTLSKVEVVKDDEWKSYQRLVLSELERLSDENKSIVEKFSILHADLIEIKTTLKIKQGILGFIAAALGAMLTALVEWAKR